MSKKKEKDVHPDFMPAFQVFCTRYRDKYGRGKMSDDTAAMFFDKLCLYDPKQFETVTTGLLGSNEWAFGWKKIVEHFSIVFPSTGNQQALEATWKSEHNKNPKKDTAQALVHLQTCILEMKKNNPTGWHEEYFKKHVEICGIEESTRIAQNLQFQFPEFKTWIYKNYRKKDGLL